MYLWFKLLHVFFTILWFAGLFAMPRLLVNLSQLTVGTVEYQRLLAMASKLMRYMTPMGVLALLFGLFAVISGQVGRLGTFKNHARRGVVGLPFLQLALVARLSRRSQSLWSTLVPLLQRSAHRFDGIGAVFGGV